MPIVSEFFGIKVMMFWRKHMPPHFHAEYSGRQCQIDIVNGVVLEGFIPGSQLKLLLAWCELHKTELLANWQKAKEHGEIHKIDPLR
jgi:hypothetical protein